MRVHLGSDHAGLELKDHLLGLAASTTATSPSTTARSSTTPSTTTPSSACAPPRAWPPSGPSGRDSLGVVIGGSGNGEQMAANKVAGRPVRAGVVRGDRRLAREHNDANVVAVGGRMHSVDDMTRFVELFLTTPFTDDERHVRRIGQVADYEETRELPPLPESARGPGPACLRATPSTGSPPTGRRCSRAAWSGCSSPQGRFADAAALLDGRELIGAEACGQAPLRRVRGRAVRPRPPRPDRHVRRSATAPEVPVAGRPGAAAAGGDRRLDGTSYADLRGATSASC